MEYILYITLLPFVTSSILHHHVYYWNFKPYIYKSNSTKNGVDGMLPEILNTAFLYCRGQNEGVTMEFHYYNKLKSHKDYLKFIRSNFTRGEGLLKEVTPDSYLWLGPFLSTEVNSKNHSWVNRGLRLTESPTAHVIVLQSWINWKYKMLEGVKNCQDYLVLSCLVSICVGAIVFLLVS